MILEAFARALRYAITGDRSEAMRSVAILGIEEGAAVMEQFPG